MQPSLGYAPTLERGGDEAEEIRVTEGLTARLAIALGIGLLIGIERERRKGSGPGRGAAGVRTFTLVSLAGGVSFSVGGEWALVATALVVGALATAAYWKSSSRDPGLTTEIALVMTVLLGALSVREPSLASGLAVFVVILLAARSRLHRFVRAVLTEQEMHDALVFAAAVLVILPLAPDRTVGPFGVLNPRTLWRLAVLVMGIGGAGHVASRALGPRFGLTILGFASGFVSSLATVGAMGERARRFPTLRPGAVAGALLSNVATMAQMTALLAATSRPTLAAMARPLVIAGLAAATYALAFAVRGARGRSPERMPEGRAFRLESSVLFAMTVGGGMMLSAAVREWQGERGLLLAASLAGFADTHAAAISVASLVATDKIHPSEAVLPILGALTTNTISKAIAAVVAGDRRYCLQVIPGLVLVILAAWAGTWPLP